MSALAQNLERKFVLLKNGKPVTLPDPNPEFTPAEVAQFYAHQHPELTTANVKGPKLENDQAIYEYSTSVGTKG